MVRFRHFERQPFGPLSEHMDQVKKCVALVKPMMEKSREKAFEDIIKLSLDVYKYEHDADKIKNEIRGEIPSAFDLPIYRGDLLAYLKLQDDVADTVEDLAVVLTIKKLAMPESIAKDIMELVDRVLEVCDYLFSCTDHLADLRESDFGGPKSKEILELVGKAEHAEWRADKAQYHASQKLFSLEDELKATDIMLWSKAFQVLGRLANYADNTAERLRRMLVR